MPRFFLHLRGSSGCRLDREGIERDRLELAIEDARRVAGEMLRHEAAGESWGPDSVVEIADCSGTVLATVPFSPDDKLTEALEETFPASDPVAMESSLVTRQPRKRDKD